MAKREFSAGGIIFRKTGKEINVLLIKDLYGHWTWPKGHIEPGEQSQDATLREVREEVGLKNVAILCRIGRTNYFFQLKGELIFKTVFFFVLEADAKEKLTIQKSEIAAAQWFNLDAAVKNVDYKGAKEMLKKAIKKYKEIKASHVHYRIPV
ncbi:MAG: NUDIX domain-containing protein [Candidatus Omnitrophota bacterium]